MNCPTCPRPGVCYSPDPGLSRFSVAFVPDHLEVDRGGNQIPGKIAKAMCGPFGSMLARQLTRLGYRWTDFGNAPAAWCAPTPREERRAALGCSHLDTYLDTQRPRVCITLGELAFERLTDEKVPPLYARGYVWPEQRGRCWVVPALPPAYYAQDAGMVGSWIEDVSKAIRVSEDQSWAYEDVESVWEPSLGWWEAYVREFLLDPSRPLGVDTEYPWKRASEKSEEDKANEHDLTDQIDEVNLAYTAGCGVSVPWREPYKEGVLAMLHASQQHGTSLFWNTPADAGRLHASGGPRFTAAHTIDLMDMFRCWRNSVRRKLGVAATFWPSMERIKPWKHLGTGDPYYRAMDAIALVRGHADMLAGLRAEGAEGAWNLFFRQLDPLLERMTAAGLAIDGAKVEGLATQCDHDMLELQGRMTAVVPPEVRPLQRRKSLDAANRLLTAEGPHATLETVAGTKTVTRCRSCGELGVTKPHVTRKTVEAV